MDDLVAFLRARLDEDEQAASAVSARKWSRYLEGGEDGWAIESEPPGCEFIVGGEAASKHVARHDPARVLAEVDAKRRIIEMEPPDHFDDPRWNGFTEGHEQMLRLLALPYAEHPDYREEWKVS